MGHVQWHVTNHVEFQNKNKSQRNITVAIIAVHEFVLARVDDRIPFIDMEDRYERDVSNEVFRCQRNVSMFHSSGNNKIEVMISCQVIREPHLIWNVHRTPLVTLVVLYGLLRYWGTFVGPLVYLSVCLDRAASERPDGGRGRRSTRRTFLKANRMQMECTLIFSFETLRKLLKCLNSSIRCFFPNKD